MSKVQFYFVEFGFFSLNIHWLLDNSCHRFVPEPSILTVNLQRAVAHLVAGLEAVDVNAQVPVGVTLQTRVLVQHVCHRRGIQAPEVNIVQFWVKYILRAVFCLFFYFCVLCVFFVVCCVLCFMLLCVIWCMQCVLCCFLCVVCYMLCAECFVLSIVYY